MSIIYSSQFCDVQFLGNKFHVVYDAHYIVPFPSASWEFCMKTVIYKFNWTHCMISYTHSTEWTLDSSSIVMLIIFYPIIIRSNIRLYIFCVMSLPHCSLFEFYIHPRMATVVQFSYKSLWQFWKSNKINNFIHVVYTTQKTASYNNNIII